MEHMDKLRDQARKNTNVNAAIIEIVHGIADGIKGLRNPAEVEEYAEHLHRNAHNFASDVLVDTKIDPAIADAEKARKKRDAREKDDARADETRRWDRERQELEDQQDRETRAVSGNREDNGTDPQGNPLDSPLPRGADGPKAVYQNPGDPNAPKHRPPSAGARGAFFDTPHPSEHPPEPGPGELKDDNGRIINPLEGSETPPKPGAKDAKPLTAKAVMGKDKDKK